MIDATFLQAVASILLIASGVQNLLVLNTQRGAGELRRTVGALTALAAIATGVLLIVTMTLVGGRA